MDIQTSFNTEVQELALENLNTDEWATVQAMAHTLIQQSELDPTGPALDIMVSSVVQGFLAGVAWTLDDAPEPDVALERARHLEIARAQPQDEVPTTEAPRAFDVENGYVVLRLSPAKAASLLEFLIGGDE